MKKVRNLTGGSILSCRALRRMFEQLDASFASRSVERERIAGT